MAEAVFLSLAYKILSTAADKVFLKAYRENSSLIWGAKKELRQLENTMRTIQALLDAVQENGGSNTAAPNATEAADRKNWIERIGEVLHEADDLFDEVVANQLLKQQMGENKLLKEVKVCFTNLNPLFSNHSIAKKVKKIRENLESIAADAKIPVPVQPPCVENRKNPGTKEGGWFINPEGILGREVELEYIRSTLLDKTSDTEIVPVIAIVGIGGVGKTTLAQLICSDEKVRTEFKKMWWASIPNVDSETDVLLRIFQSMNGGQSYCGDPGQLNFQIGNLVTKTRGDTSNYLLILDGVLNENLEIWIDIIRLLSTGAKGSRIIVTTRYPQVAQVMHATKIPLQGLPEDSSWKLFQEIAFHQDQQHDARKKKLGKEIHDRCANNPLAIKSIATLLSSKPSIEDWQSIRDDPKLSEGADSVISRLRVSFDHLKPELKPCFAYCSLFPKRYKIVKEELIDLWIAQGYVKETGNVTLHSVGGGYFNELVDLEFFPDLVKDKQGEIVACQMHDLYHQLAQEVAGEQSVILTEQLIKINKKIRHVAVGYQMADTWNIPDSLLAADRLRSSLFIYRGSLSAPVVDKLVTEFKFLRALDLEYLKVDSVSESVGALKHLRYLNLSGNTFTSLPSSLSKLVNLLTLDISRCEQLKALPDDFRKLINLRVLNAKGCCSLRHMPPRFGELKSLQYLSYFYVGEQRSEGGYVSTRLKKIIPEKDAGIDHQLPKNLRVLNIEKPANGMPHWADIHSLFSKLEKLHIFNSQAVKGLPPFRCLASLRDLQLSELEQLEYIEESGGSTQSADTSSASSFFPSLHNLTLRSLPNLKGWLNQSSSISAAAKQKLRFTCLDTVRIEDCNQLESIPLSESLETLELRDVHEELVKHLLSASKDLTTLTIWGSGWSKFEFKSFIKLQTLQLGRCHKLTELCVEPPQDSILKKLQIEDCRMLDSFGRNGVMDWASFPKLCLLIRDKIKIKRPRDNCQHTLIEREESQE